MSGLCLALLNTFIINENASIYLINPSECAAQAFYKDATYMYVP